MFDSIFIPAMSSIFVRTWKCIIWFFAYNNKISERQREREREYFWPLKFGVVYHKILAFHNLLKLVCFELVKYKGHLMVRLRTKINENVIINTK